MFKKIIITSIIIYIPNQLHFPSSLGVPGINVFNILYFILFFLYLSRDNKSTIKSPLSSALIFYYISVIIAMLFSIGVTSHLTENFTILKNIIVYSSLYFLVFSLVDNEDDLKYYIKIVYFVVFMMALEIIKEKLSFGLSSDKRVAGAFGQDLSSANYAGVFVAIFIPLLLQNFLFKSKEFINPKISIGIFIMGVFAIFYTYSRQAYGSIVITSVLNLAKRNKIFLITVIILLLNGAYWLPDTVLDRIQGTQVQSSDTGEEKLDDSTESRFVIWQAAYDNMITVYPLGVGLNEFQDRLDPFMPDWIPARDAHNSFILILSENGIFGFIAFCFLLYKMHSVGRMIKLKSDVEHVKMLGEGYQLIVIAVVLGNIYSSTFYSPEVMGNFWILSALIHKYYFLSTEKTMDSTVINGNNSGKE